MDGMRMLREEECVMNEEIGVLCSGKRFRPNKKRIVAEREGKHSEIEERDTGVILQIEGICAHRRKYMSTQSSRRRSHSDQTLRRTHDPVCVTKN
jgi:hypothetical protein